MIPYCALRDAVLNWGNGSALTAQRFGYVSRRSGTRALTGRSAQRCPVGGGTACVVDIIRWNLSAAVARRLP